MRIGVADCTAANGEVLLVRAGQLYSFAPGDINTGLLCHFHDDFLRGAGPELLRHGQPLIRLGAEAAGYAESLLRRLLTEFSAHGRQHSDLLRAYLLAVLQELVHAPAPAPTPPPAAGGSLAEHFQQQVMASRTACAT